MWDSPSCRSSSFDIPTAQEGPCNTFSPSHHRRIHQLKRPISAWHVSSPVQVHMSRRKRRQKTEGKYNLKNRLHSLLIARSNEISSLSTKKYERQVGWHKSARSLTHHHTHLLARFRLGKSLVEWVPCLVVQKPTIHCVSSDPIIPRSKRSIIGKLGRENKF